MKKILYFLIALIGTVVGFLLLSQDTSDTPRYTHTKISCTPTKSVVQVIPPKAIQLGPPGGYYPEDFIAMQELGVSWIRYEFNWSFIEPEKGVFDWSNYDKVVRDAGARNMHVLALLTYSPKWESGSRNQYYAPKDLENWEHFVKAAVERYKPGGAFSKQEGNNNAYGVTHWEIWEEPNLPSFWKPAPRADDYVELLQRANRVIRAEDPNAVIAIGGLSSGGEGENTPVSFLEKMYTQGAKDCFDIVSVHPFIFPQAPKDVPGFIAPVRALMNRQGDDKKPIWITSFGYRTTGEVTETGQARYVKDIYDELRKGYVEAMFWFNLRDFSSEDTFGLLREDFSRKPSFEAYKNIR